MDGRQTPAKRPTGPAKAHRNRRGRSAVTHDTPEPRRRRRARTNATLSQPRCSRPQDRRTPIHTNLLGVCPSGSELIVCGRTAEWLLTPDLAVAIVDQFQWRGRAMPWSVLAWLSFLYEVFRARPELLRRWVARLLTASETANRGALAEATAELLVAHALNSMEVDATTFTRALLDSIERARELCSGPLGDPARGGLERITWPSRGRDTPARLRVPRWSGPG